MRYLNPMRIATWNINGIRARLEFVERWLAERQPDIVGFQELKSEEADFPFDELARCGYHAVIHGQKAWNGVAVLSREPVELIQTGLPGREADGARLLAARRGDMRFITIYCPNGKNVDHPDFAEKLAWYDALQAYLVEHHDPTEPLVLCGDFNVVPAAIDSWSEDLLEGAIFHTVAERERIQRLLDWGLVDVWREREPAKPGFTWWDYRQGAFRKKRGLRIDFLLATRPVVDRVQFVQPDVTWRQYIGELKASDHAPLYMDLGE